MPDVIAGVLPEHEVSILAGASGAGKTTLLMQIVKQLQDCDQVFGHKSLCGLKIGYVAADRTWKAYEILCNNVKVDIGTMHVKALIDDPDIDIGLFERSPRVFLYGLLSEMVKAGCNLLIVDPLVSLLGGDPNKYGQMAPRLIQLNRFCIQNKVTILGTHHAGKARTDFGFKRAQDRISGSSALLGFTSTHLFLAAAEEIQQPYCEWHIVSHHAKAEVIKLKRTDPHGLFDLFTIDDEIAQTSEKKADCTLELLDILPPDGTPMPRKTLVGLLSEKASPRTIDALLKQLVSSKVLVHYPNGYYGIKKH